MVKTCAFLLPEGLVQVSAQREKQFSTNQIKVYDYEKEIIFFPNGSTVVVCGL